MAQGYGPLRGVRAVYAQAPPGLQKWRFPAQTHPNAVLRCKLQDPDPEEVKGGWASPEIPTKVNMMRVICSPEDMDTIKPQAIGRRISDSRFDERRVTRWPPASRAWPTMRSRCRPRHPASAFTSSDCHKMRLLAGEVKPRIDIMAPGTNKAAGLHVLLEALQLSMAEVCAIGDSENDLETKKSGGASRSPKSHESRALTRVAVQCARRCCNPSALPAPWAMPPC